MHYCNILTDDLFLSILLCFCFSWVVVCFFFFFGFGLLWPDLQHVVFLEELG